VHGLRQRYHRLKNHFGCTQWNSKVTWLKWKLILAHLEIVLILMQGRCTVALNVPKAKKSFWTRLMESLSDVRHVKSRFGPFGDGVCVSAR
jgi:hypothetical protein